MEAPELLEALSQGEDSHNQFKANMTNADSLAQEFVAFSNSGGGRLYIGVSDDGSVAGLLPEDVGRLNQLISNAASNSVRPAINPETENVSTPMGLVIVVHVLDGLNKPYTDKDGATWVKSGADKRRATSREEIQRLFQSASLIHGDEIPAAGLTVADIDVPYFEAFYEKVFGEDLSSRDMPIQNLLQNMNLLRGEHLNIAAALLFARSPQFRLPVFIVKAIAFPHEDIDFENYLDSRDITGKLADVYDHSLSFVVNNITHHQADQSVNSIGELEVPKIVFEELIANALIHRDYFVSATIRIFIFKNRIELISPGHLPNNLTVTNIVNGNSNIRNPILASYATRLLPYRGLGSGILRAIRAYPYIEFEDDRDGNLFKVTISRITSVEKNVSSVESLAE